MKSVLCVALLLALVVGATADVYIHSPRGGSNRCDEASNDRQTERLFNSQDNAAGGYPVAPQMFYYSGSILQLEWTSQHACGENANMGCDLIWQYMCSPTIKDGDPADPSGGTTSTCTTEINAGNENSPQVGRHESLSFFTDCNTRRRNTGLFLADQNIGTTQNAQHTRQNPGGGTTGFECQEERDYYPYWHPTPWIDLAILTSNVSRCAYYKANSENVKGRSYCNNPTFNNQADCEGAGAAWLTAPSHRDSRPFTGIGKPDCKMAPWQRDNHLGSTGNGYMSTYNATVPKVDPVDAVSCVLRLRYNATSNDYDGWNTYSGSNGGNSPIQTNPYIMMGDMPMRLALDTTQFARTFEDRTFTFAVRPPFTNSLTATVYNINVRGKRGNIAQVRNCMEYDFVPQILHAAVGDLLHFQWTGSNFEPNGNAGEGTAGTDRHNFAQIVSNDPAANYPEPLMSQRFFKEDATAYLFTHVGQSQFTTCADLSTLQAREAAGQNVNQQADNCAKLNGLPIGYFNHAPLRANWTMNYNYMSTRNNNFTNRSQKGHLRIRAFSPKLLLAVGSVAGVAVVAGALGSIYYVAKKNGTSFSGAFGRKSGSSSGSGAHSSSGRSHGSHRSKQSKSSKSGKSSFGGSMI